MFKFDFLSKENENNCVPNTTELNNCDDGLEWIPASVISPETYSDIRIPDDWGSLTVNGCNMYHIRPSEINSFIQANNDLLSADIIPAKYEGGLKIWDCTYHLIEFLTNRDNQIEFKNKTVLDLGCGNGLLGIVAFTLGSSSVHFQDYNEDVIKLTTIPSVIKNLEQLNEDKIKCKYYFGDWMSFSELIKDQYDIILTSATIYNTYNYNKIISVFKRGLKKGGVIFIAAKTYYFGNGGGTRQFEEALMKDGNFYSEVLWKSSEGVQQEILKVIYQNK